MVTIDSHTTLPVSAPEAPSEALRETEPSPETEALMFALRIPPPPLLPTRCGLPQ